MNTLLLYCIKTVAYSGAFYLMYRLLLASDTLHGRNRLYILISLVASALLPFLVITTNEPIDIQVFGKTLPEIMISTDQGARSLISLPSLASLGIACYAAGLLFFLFRSVLAVIPVLRITRGHEPGNGNIIRSSEISTSGFSVMRWIVINTSLNEYEAHEIIKHEQHHIDKRHYIDLIILETISVFMWFNPFVHLLGRSLKEIHEFQADSACTGPGVRTIEYQNLILNQVFGVRIPGLSSSFSGPTILKKRIMMMTKKRTGRLANLKIFMVIPVVAILLLAFSSCRDKSVAGNDDERKVEFTQQASSTPQGTDTPPPPPPPGSEEKKVIKGQEAGEAAPPPPPPPPPYSIKDGDTIWVVVEKMPIFKSPNSDEKILAYLKESIKYPANAAKNGIQGRVIVRFAVEKDGSVSNTTVLRGVDPELDAEALRVVKSMPDFENPGYNKGKPVMVWYMVPITFALK